MAHLRWHLVLLCWLICAARSRSGPTPVVLYHGMGDFAKGSIQSIADHLRDQIEDLYVVSVQMGNNSMEDLLSSYFMDINEQVDDACRQLSSDSRLSGGFHAIGFSQGGQILRGIAQRCPNITMLNLISLGGQHQGVYGLPRCPDRSAICDYVRKLVNYGAYEDYIQKHVVQAQYWHDPLQEDLYRSKSLFLADINNENTKNPLYKQKLASLRNLVLVGFLNDSMVEPRQSSLFGFYKPGQARALYTMQDSPLYQEDWIGLKLLDNSGKLHLMEVIGDHLQISIDWFDQQIVDKYLKT